jgi:hypothetical protein
MPQINNSRNGIGKNKTLVIIKNMNKKVVITGTNGFIGSNLREELKSKYQIVEINEDLLDLPDWTEKINIF